MDTLWTIKDCQGDEVLEPWQRFRAQDHTAAERYAQGKWGYNFRSRCGNCGDSSYRVYEIEEDEPEAAL